jgi:hypothetical protein
MQQLAPSMVARKLSIGGAFSFSVNHNVMI